MSRIPLGSTQVRAVAGSRAAVLVRRGYVCAHEAGPRPLPPPDRVLRWGRPLLLPLSSVASVATPDQVVALTYDDGPDPDHTSGVLDALAAAGARATFFVLVERAEQHPELLRRIVAEGHEVGLHGIDHARLSPLSTRRSLSLIREGKRRLESLLGERVRLYRPTYGAQRLPQFIGTRLLGMEVVVWTAWARDWEGVPAPEIARRAIAALHPGGVLLLHDSSGDGVGDGGLDRAAASRELLAGMAELGYSGIGVGELLERYPAVRVVWAESASAGRAAAGFTTMGRG